MIRKIPILLIIGFLFTGMLWGQSQQKKKIPESKPLPEQKQMKQDTTVREAQERRLELPDVLIVGKNTVLHIPKEKKIRYPDFSIIPESEVSLRQLPESPDSTNPEQTPSFNPTKINHATDIDIHFGNYNTAFIQANHWQKTGAFTLNFKSRYTRSDGQYENSQYERWRAGLFGKWQLASNQQLQGGGKYAANEYGLWASDIHERKWHQLTWRIGLNGKLSSNISYNIDFTEDQIPLQDNIEISNTVEPFWVDSLTLYQEKNRHLTASLSYNSNEWEFGLKANALQNGVTPYQAGVAINPENIPLQENHNSISQISINATRYLGGQGALTLGVRYQYYQLETYREEESSRVNPFVQLNYELSSDWLFFASYQPKWKLRTHQDMIELNPFANMGLSFDPIEDTRFSFDIGAEWKPGSAMLVRATYLHRSIDNYLIWHRSFQSQENESPQIELFELTSIPKVHLSFAKVDFRLGQSDPFRFHSTLLFSFSGIDELATPPEQAPKTTSDIPYIEDVSWPIEFAYRFQKDWTASVIAKYYGSRSFSVYSQKKGKSIWLLNAKLNYELSGINFYLLVRNLLNQNYVIWQNYPETGTQFFAGVETQF